MTAALIDDLAGERAAGGGGGWECVSDTVMGGISRGELRTETVAGRRARHLTGTVSLANDGGFLQMALDLAPGGRTVDASAFTGLALTVCGDGAGYGVHLRSADVTRPWQSYRAPFTAPRAWTRITLPFSAFTAHRIGHPLDTTRLRRIGLVAIGRPGDVSLALAHLAFY